MTYDLDYLTCVFLRPCRLVYSHRSSGISMSRCAIRSSGRHPVVPGKFHPKMSPSQFHPSFPHPTTRITTTTTTTPSEKTPLIVRTPSKVYVVFGWSPATNKHDAVVVLVVLAYSSSVLLPSSCPIRIRPRLASNVPRSDTAQQRARVPACLVSAGSGNGQFRLCPTGLIHPRGWLAQPRTRTRTRARTKTHWVRIRCLQVPVASQRQGGGRAGRRAGGYCTTRALTCSGPGLAHGRHRAACRLQSSPSWGRSLLASCRPDFSRKTALAQWKRRAHQQSLHPPVCM